MQLVPNGPDVPDDLTDAHERGDLVFFCGAGISMPLGLPSFKDLVQQMYQQLGATWRDQADEEHAFNDAQYDVTLERLERRVNGGRHTVRRALQAVLQKAITPGLTSSTHEALLTLSRTGNGATRLVTTNFDRIFEEVIRASGLRTPSQPAPSLPVPKRSRWDGLVYLHGLLPEDDNSVALNNIVITSGDFGLAYLVEGWAARFVSALLQNFIVCFVGYSINDPVIEYILDALVADQMLGEITHKAYAFAASLPGEESSTRARWQAKGVEPVIYSTPEKHDHTLLHKTLVAWAEKYRRHPQD